MGVDETFRRQAFGWISLRRFSLLPGTSEVTMTQGSASDDVLDEATTKSYVINGRPYTDVT